MFYRSSSPFTTPLHWILDVVSRSLEDSLSQEASRRYDAGLILRAENRSEDGTSMRAHIECRGLTKLPFRVEVTPVGGNVYDLQCAVEDGASRRFSYSLPDKTGSALSRAPYLGRKMARFLLTELEKRLGQLLLQRPVCPPRHSSSTTS